MPVLFMESLGGDLKYVRNNKFYSGIWWQYDIMQKLEIGGCSLYYM